VQHRDLCPQVGGQTVTDPVGAQLSQRASVDAVLDQQAGPLPKDVTSGTSGARIPAARASIAISASCSTSWAGVRGRAGRPACRTQHQAL